MYVRLVTFLEKSGCLYLYLSGQKLDFHNIEHKKPKENDENSANPRKPYPISKKQLTEKTGYSPQNNKHRAETENEK